MSATADQGRLQSYTQMMEQAGNACQGQTLQLILIFQCSIIDEEKNVFLTLTKCVVVTKLFFFINHGQLGQALVLQANDRLGWIYLLGTNSIAFLLFQCSIIDKEKNVFFNIDKRCLQKKLSTSTTADQGRLWSDTQMIDQAGNACWAQTLQLIL